MKRDFSADIVWIRTIARKNGIVLNEKMLDKLLCFADNILLWNAKINLLSRKDEENIWRKHILESLIFLFFCRFDSPSTIVDFGTGGGFPGIPLAICLPMCEFVLIDSTQKKVRAVEDILKKLQLPNVTTSAGRGEDLAMTSVYHEKFDYLLARAVAPLRDLLKWGTPFLKKCAEEGNDQEATRRRIIPRGTMILMKGGILDAELAEARIKCRPHSVEVVPVVIEGNDSPDLVDKKLIIIKP